MKRRTVLLTSLAMIPGPVIAAAPPSQCFNSELYQVARTEAGVEHRDFDHDGIADLLKVDEDNSGSGAYTATVELWLSTLSTFVNIELLVSFESFINVTPVPDELLNPGMADARIAVASVLFPVVCTHPDPSFAWLLNSDSPIVWHAGSPKLPETYVLYTDDPHILAKAEREWTWTLVVEREFPKLRAAWIAYTGLNHRRLDLAIDGHAEREATDFATLDRAGNLELLGTAHGVVLFDSKRNRHAWIFVQAGGQKLRWPTIDSARFQGSRADIKISVLHQTGIASVDLLSGIVHSRFCSNSDWNEATQTCDENAEEQALEDRR